MDKQTIIASFILFLLRGEVLGATAPPVQCPDAAKFGAGPPSESFCLKPSDPNNLPPSKLESWFTKEMFQDLFPKANLGWGPTACWPYSYEAFIMAARYFPTFGTTSPNTEYSEIDNTRRDVSAFFAHAIQETGENDPSLFQKLPLQEAKDCFYRGGFFNWFEGGPTSSFLDPNNPGYKPEDGVVCNTGGSYCGRSTELDYWYPCRTDNEGCYFGRGAIQISYNYNYGMFQQFLKTKNISADLLEHPNLVMTKMDPPIGIMASLWFYMTPQPPKPAMHDIVLGQWNSGPDNKAAGYEGPIFGPTSLVINNECGGESADEPGGGGENRRIKAFKWFCSYFGVPYGDDKLLSCKDMPVKLNQIKYPYSYAPNWATTWKEEPCDCAPANYGGVIPYFDPDYYPLEWSSQNEKYRKLCAWSIYDNPKMYMLDNVTSACLNHPMPDA